MKRIILNIGELAVSKEAATLETILGSCVAVCLWDGQQRIGGLNHYLLPCEQPGAEKSTLYGATSIDALIGEILKIGADIRSLRAQIFGGGSVISQLDEMFDIGNENVQIARERLRCHGIPVVGEYIRDKNGIRVVLKTETGETTVRPLGNDAGAGAATQTMAARRQTQPCKTCILCGSCAELMKRKRRNSHT